MFEVFMLIIRVAERKIHHGWQNRHKRCLDWPLISWNSCWSLIRFNHFLRYDLHTIKNDKVMCYGRGTSTSRRWILLFTICKKTAVCSIAKWTESLSGKQTRRATLKQNDQNVKVGKKEQLKCARLCLLLENSLKPLNACNVRSIIVNPPPLFF